MGIGWMDGSVKRDRGRPLTPGQPPCPHPSRPLLKLFPLPRPSLAPALPDPVHQIWLKCHLLQEGCSEPYTILPPSVHSDNLFMSVS